MKPYLVDVPVRVNIWIRPECQQAQFEVLKKARPSILFLQSDGGRNEKEWDAIRKNRELFETEIDWDCTVHRLYEDHNLGLYAMSLKVRSYIFERVDRCIFLEDDQLPSVSFFRYCAELLERYKDDERIECICGMNHLGVSENVTADYFFSRQGAIWGIARWKRTEESRDYTFSYGKDPYVMDLLKQRAKHNPTFLKRANAYAKQTHYEGHVAGGEFFLELAMYAQNRLQIIPKVNMIRNIGVSEDAAHATSLSLLPRGIRRVFNMETYEIEFPMKHAEFVIPDVDYEKKRNRVMAYNRPLIAAWRRLESMWLALINGKLLDRLKKKLNKRHQLEK